MTHVHGKRGRHRQRGQSTVEFLIALIALIPIYLGVVYAGKYGDIKLATVQASRYAAFQRATEPSEARLSKPTLEDQMRARFFVAGNYLHAGKLQSDDSVARLAPANGQTSLWRDLQFRQLLSDHKQVRLEFENASLGTAEKLLEVPGKLYRLPAAGLKVAQVEVGLVNKMDQTSSSPPLLKIGAATAAGGDAWNANGGHNVADRIALASPESELGKLKSFDDLINLALHLFEDTDLTLGCVKPDVVPGSRLKGYVGAQACITN